MHRTPRECARVSALVFALSLAYSLPAQSVLTTVRDIRTLSPQRAQASLPVVLHGTVTTLSGWKNSFFFDDGTAGISIDRTTVDPPTEQGDFVEVRGHTSPGLFAPVVIADSVSVEGSRALPTPRVYTAAELIGGSRDSQWIAVRGIVRTAQIKPLWGKPRLMLSVDIGQGTLISAVVQKFTADSIRTYTSATVLLRGVCGTVFNDRRQYIGIRLFVSSANDIDIEHPAPHEPFELPERPLSGIMQFREQNERVGQVKVSGTVTWSRPGSGIYIQDKDQSLFVQSGMEHSVPVGARVEAVGYPSQGAYAPQLENSIFQQIGSASPIRPIAAPAAAMIVNRDGFASVPYDAMLVRMKGKLLEQLRRGDESVLLLQDGNTVFSARLASSAMGSTSFDAGTLLEVTGICQITVNEAREPRSFTLLARSQDDFYVLQAAPWWTARHASWAVCLLFFIALAMAGCIAFLRREARLRALVVEDPLTGLYNRRGFLAFAQDRWLLAQRQASPLLLFYIDLDRFKPINDTFGHKEGDQALLRVTALLRETFRKTDVIGRLGGDEFAVVAIDAAESVRATLEDRLLASLAHLNAKARLPFAIELSMGVIECNPTQETSTIEDLLARADQVMYEQKRRRRTTAVPQVDPEEDLEAAMAPAVTA